MQYINAAAEAVARGVRYTGAVEEPHQPATAVQPPPAPPELAPAPAPEPVLETSPPASRPGGDPEFVHAIEAKLRAIPLWLVLAGALAIGLAVGGIGYLLRGLMDALFGRTP